MRRMCFLVIGSCLFAVPAVGQTTPRVTISAGAALQPARSSFADITDFPYFVETARLEAAYKVDDGVALDIGGAVGVWRRLALRMGVTRLTRSTTAETRGSFPHPFYFGTNRTGSWSLDALDRTELGIHVSADWKLAQNARYSVSVFGGPSLLSFKQTVVDNVEVIQSYAYDSIDARLNTGTITGSVPGFNAGADVGWFFSRYFGLGGVIRFARGTKKNARIGDGVPFDLEVGGAQGGAGIRVRF